MFPFTLMISTLYKLYFSVFIVWLFHISALIGIALGHEAWFIPKTPLTLGLCLGLIVWNIPKLMPKDLLALVVPFAIGMIAEMLGVNFGLIFGHYQYGNNLGIKILGVPLMIGVNWVILTYATVAIAQKLSHHLLISSIVAALLMVLLDVSIEQLAPRFDFWRFQNGVVPLQNYVGWFGVSLVGNIIFGTMFKKGNFTLALHIYCAFYVFFTVFLF
jgi:bisanhydrobacterioruberin hydratase